MLQFIKSLFGSSQVQLDQPLHSKTTNVFLEMVHDIIAHWPSSKPFRVSEVLLTHPELSLDSRAMIELAIEEFMDGRNRGSNVTPTAFAEQYPDIRTALLDSLAVDLEISQLSGIFSHSIVKDNKAVCWPEVGEVLANFRLKELLGKGGFSQVYLAEDLELNNREVAVKICREDTHEASTLADLQHTAIGVVLGVRRIEARKMIAISMQVISRVTLNDVIRHLWKPKQSKLKTRSTPRLASSVWDAIKANGYSDHPTPDWTRTSFVDWVIQAAINLSRGLAASHAKGYVHCDLKPSNVLITTEGAPVLIDFNVAFKHNANQSPGNVGGTLPYMAPEQIRAFSGRGYADIGPQTDVFGLGATLYQLLTGTMPFDAEMSAADGIRALLQSRQVTPKPMRAFHPEIDERLERLIMKCLNYEVGSRPQNTLEVARELERIQESRRTQIANPPKTSVMDRRRIGAALALAGAALVAVAIHEKIDKDVPQPVVQTPGAVETPPAGPEEPVPKSRSISEILIGGLEDLRLGDLVTAEAKFTQVMKLDPQHQGAMLGLARAKAQLKKAAEAEQLLNQIQWQAQQEPGEILAFRAYCKLQQLQSPPDRLKHLNEAIRDSEAALVHGFDNPRMLTNLAYCYAKKGSEARSVELLERARVKAPNLPETNIMLAAVYWNCRAATGVPLGKFDLQYLSEVLENPPKDAASCWRLADMFSAFAATQSTTNPQLCSELSQVGVDFFQRACALNWDRNFWNHIHPRLSPEVRSEVEGQFADVPADLKPQYPTTNSSVLDPLHNTRFDRVLSRQLSVGKPLIGFLAK